MNSLADEATVDNMTANLEFRGNSHSAAEDDVTMQESKSFGLNDPYKHAPPKPDSDPWAILLKPELEADKMRCDAWKEEVQNLLIFAGLFSAVVTAFVIESYKLLQPDPNNAIVDLLSQIVNNINATSSSSPSAIALARTTTSFVQTPSSIRINVFWFLSLILSLTTVLVGTIALQWLREHQAYPGYSAKEILAILHMRSEAIEAWHIPQIFATLPLLLQAALVLFFAGLIDFSLSLGTLKLTVPVVFVIGLTLLFLAATTILPAFQDIFLILPIYSRNKVPTPCAFKSPQSHAFRALSRIFLQLLPEYDEVASRHLRKSLFPTNRLHLLRHIYIIWDQKTWPSFDREWLSLRDACHQGILDQDFDLHIHRQHYKDIFPLSDITQCLNKRIKDAPSTQHTESFLIAIYSCCQEISSSIWNAKTLQTSNFLGRPDRHNNYLEQLVQNHPDDCSLSLSKFLIHGSSYKYARFPNFSYSDTPYSTYIKQHHALFYCDQTYLFLALLLQQHKSPILQRYRLELESRMMRYLLKNAYVPLTPCITDELPFPSLAILQVSYDFDQGRITDDSDYMVDFIATIFETVASSRITQDQLMVSIYTHQHMPKVLDRMAAKTIAYLQLAAKDADVPNRKHVEEINAQYRSTFQLIARHLTRDMGTQGASDTPSVLFYLASIFVHRLLCQPANHTQRVFPSENDNAFRQGLSDLLSTLAKYKTWMADRRNDAIESRFMVMEAMYIRQADWGIRFEQAQRFSKHWWDSLFNNSEAFGLRATEEDTTPDPDVILSPSSSSKEENIPTSHSASPMARPLPSLSAPRTMYGPITSENITSIPSSSSSLALPGSLNQRSPFIALDMSLPFSIHQFSTILPPADEGPQ